MTECRLALFVDFENIARGVRQRHLEERVDLRAILGELEEKGRILVKRAYADWGYFKDYRSDLLQQGIEPVQVFAAARDREGWKNGADIRIAIDAIETAFRAPDITDFVLVTGDSDFLSLVNRLRENGKTVWGVGLKSSSSRVPGEELRPLRLLRRDRGVAAGRAGRERRLPARLPDPPSGHPAPDGGPAGPARACRPRARP